MGISGFLRFVFSGFWSWLGFFLLVYIIFWGVAEVVKAARRTRTVKISTSDNFRIVEVNGATDEDVRLAVGGEEVNQQEV